MPYQQPLDYGFVQTPPPGGGGTGFESWTTIPLSVAGFTAYGVGTDWTISNPDASTLRVESDHTAKLTWDNTGTQTGLVLIWPVALNSFPSKPNPSFPTDQWRPEYSVVKIGCQLTIGTTHASGNPLRIQGGPGFVTFTNDQLGSPAGPPFTDSAAEPSWYAHNVVANRGNGNDEWNPAWTGNQFNGWHNPGGGQFLPAFGAVGQANTATISIGLSGVPNGDQAPCVSWSWGDSRVPTADSKWSHSEVLNENVAADLKISSKYIFPALFFGNWNSTQVGDFIEVTDFQFAVGQLPGPGAE